MSGQPVGLEARPVPPGVGVGVAIASTLLSAFLGLGASLLSMLEGPKGRHLAWSGLAFGAVTGLVAALGWIEWMQRGNVASRRGGLVLRGMAGGVIAGSLASAVVHAALSLVAVVLPADAPEWWLAQLIGQVFALPAGAMLGLAGGIGWNRSLPPPP